jgi:predicted nucleotidyltransferase
LNRTKLVSYAMSFLSFCFRRPELGGNDIRMVSLFGSVARGDFGNNSDIDIFVDTEKKNEDKLKKKFLYFYGKFRESEEFRRWKLLGIENEISVNVGDINEWELKDNVLSGGIMLYGRPSLQKKRQYLVTFEPIKEIARRNRVTRRVFGRTEKHYEDEGLVKNAGGEILSPRSFLIPGTELKKILEIFSNENVKYRIKEIWTGGAD